MQQEGPTSSHYSTVGIVVKSHQITAMVVCERVYLHSFVRNRIVTHTKLPILDSLPRTVVNLASSGTDVNPIGCCIFAFKPDVNLSTRWTVALSSGLD